ncbi:MAG: hypothetical protein H8E38_01915 [SAR324 cluster bacterium]|nr:hypothetical protein [SAR324 cluster bacterium]MBL7034243.1 hypothetical protein [SAR324 cluster bacterium]
MRDILLILLTATLAFSGQAIAQPKATQENCIASGNPEVKLTITQIPPECPLQYPFVKYLSVFGVNVVATSSVSDKKMLHAGNVLAQYLDNNEDGTPDDKKVLEMLTGEKATLVMASESEFEEFMEGEPPEDIAIQDLLVDETRPEFHQGDYSRFDASLEEVLHLVQAVGWANTFPEVFGTEPGSKLADAMDKARGGHFEELPGNYPSGAWYSYDDETCDYGCQVIEYSYWVTTTLLGAHDYPNRADEIGEEWKLTKVSDLKAKDEGWKIITSSDFKQPTKKLPDGNYLGL